MRKQSEIYCEKNIGYTFKEIQNHLQLMGLWSNGMTLPWHGRGSAFDSRQVHFLFCNILCTAKQKRREHSKRWRIRLCERIFKRSLKSSRVARKRNERIFRHHIMHWAKIVYTVTKIGRITTKKYLNFRTSPHIMARDPSNYGENNIEPIETYGARFIQRDCAFDALIAGTLQFEHEINSQIDAYGKEDTCKVVEFLIGVMNNKTLPESLPKTNFTEKQKAYLLSITNPEYSEKISQARMDLGNAYRKCDWECI